jgi:hypothetical protein
MKLTTLNDVEWELGYDNNFHDPYDNHRYSIGATLDSSDYYHSTELKYQFGEFEETDYDELMVAKNLLPHER